MQQLRALADKINGGRTGRERGEESAAARFGRGNTWRSHWKEENGKKKGESTGEERVEEIVRTER
jgi:hypothetical protein